MDQDNVDRIVCNRLEAFADILGEEVGAIQRKSDRKMAAELKRVQLSFAAVWEELNTLRDKIANLQKNAPHSPIAAKLDDSVNVAVLKYARAS